MFLESYVLDVIEDRTKRSYVRKSLWVLSKLYKIGISFRHFFYDFKWIKTANVSIPVVSIGNIVCGGTGKTPLVRKLAEELLQFTKIAILSRGYRSKIERSGEVVHIASGRGPLFSSTMCGDEPYMLSSQLPEALVWVGKNRYLAAKSAIKQGAKVLLLDDGMQYRKLKKDVEIVVVDGQDPFGKGHFLPRGLLREDPKRLSQADFVIINHMEDKEQFEKIKIELGRYTTAPMIGMSMQFQDMELDQKVGVFCGIGKPERFLQGITKRGSQIVSQLIASDHEAFTEQALEKFADSCKEMGATRLLCTEKDMVKLPLDLRLSLPLTAVKAELTVTFGQNDWQELIEKIKNKI